MTTKDVCITEIASRYYIIDPSDMMFLQDYLSSQGNWGPRFTRCFDFAIRFPTYHDAYTFLVEVNQAKGAIMFKLVVSDKVDKASGRVQWWLRNKVHEVFGQPEIQEGVRHMEL